MMFTYISISSRTFSNFVGCCIYKSRYSPKTPLLNSSNYARCNMLNLAVYTSHDLISSICLGSLFENQIVLTFSSSLRRSPNPIHYIKYLHPFLFNVSTFRITTQILTCNFSCTFIFASPSRFTVPVNIKCQLFSFCSVSPFSIWWALSVYSILPPSLEYIFKVLQSQELKRTARTFSPRRPSMFWEACS